LCVPEKKKGGTERDEDRANWGAFLVEGKGFSVESALTEGWGEAESVVKKSAAGWEVEEKPEVEGKGSEICFAELH